MIYLRKFDYGTAARGERKKNETLNGRMLLRDAVFNEYGVSTDNLDIENGEHGKPYFVQRRDIHFNISHSGCYVAVAVGEYPLGVDVQTVREVKQSLIEKLCDDNEKRFVEQSGDKDKAFITLWALKESYIKAIGTGMSYPMNRIHFDMKNFDTEAFGDFSDCDGYYYVRAFEDFVLAVCVLGDISDNECEKWRVIKTLT